MTLNEQWLLDTLYKRLTKEYNKVQILILLEINRELLGNWLKQQIEDDEEIQDTVERFLELVSENITAEEKQIKEYMKVLQAKITYRSKINEKQN